MKTLFGVAFFGKPFELKNQEAKKQSNNIHTPSHAQILGETHEPYFTLPRIFGETKNLYGKLKERIMGEAE